MENEKEFLEHHGILGQRWGKKQGPPYPLDDSDHSASEKKAGYKKSIKNMTDEELEKGINRLNQEKKYIDLLNAQNPVKEKGESAVTKILKESGKTALGIVTVSVFVQMGKKAVKSAAPEFSKDMEWKKINKK